MGDSPAELLDVFRVSAGDPDSRMALIRHPNMERAALIDFILEDELGDIALSMTDDPEILDLFAEAVDPAWRKLVAFNAATPTDTVELLATDPDPGVRANAAYGPQLTTETRARLARHDPDDTVREEAWHAMTTAQGRTITEGARKATLEDGELVWVVVKP